MSSTSAEDAVLVFSFQLRSLTAELNSALATLFRPLGLSCVQAEALMALDLLGPVSLKELAANLVAESGHPSRLVSRLVADGMVIRTSSPTDGRAVVLELTDLGRELAEKARMARRPLLTEFAQMHGDRVPATAEHLRELRTHLAEQHQRIRSEIPENPRLPGGKWWSSVGASQTPGGHSRL